MLVSLYEVGSLSKLVEHEGELIKDPKIALALVERMPLENEICISLVRSIWREFDQKKVRKATETGNRFEYNFPNGVHRGKVLNGTWKEEMRQRVQ